MKTIEQLQADMNNLLDDKAQIEQRIRDTQCALSRLILDAYPHKEGDVIKSKRGDAKVKSVIVGEDGEVFMLIRYRLPSGRWSNKTSYHW
jgi:hypothetical protein